LLKDVALIKDADEAASAQLGYLSLGMAPSPGYTRYIARETITARLMNQGFEADALEIQGAEGVLVKVESVQISGEELLQWGREFLDGQLADLEGDFVVETDRIPLDLLVPAGRGLASFDVKWHNVPRSRGNVSLDLQVKVDGELYTTVSLRFKVRHFAPVLVATREIQIDERFTNANSMVVRTEITQVKGNLARSHETMASYLCRRKVASGSVIRIESGYLPDLVERGSAVKITVRKGGLSIRSRGVARQAGALGDTVEIMNPDSGRTFRSVVTGLNEVVVNL
ncbi:MAG: flagellar basal body P-ring formation chaperone FlgA, partial [Planctomycetota bacterium]